MDLKNYAKKEKIKYFMVTYTDLFGVQRAKLVPASAISDMQKDGAGFAGFASWLDMTPAYPDMLAVPDPQSVIKLPWKKDVAWLASNCMMEDKLVEQAPRNVLNKAIARAKKGNMRVKTGVEAEFFLLTSDGLAISDPYDNAEKPCYDQQALMRRYDVIAEICDYPLHLGVTEAGGLFTGSIKSSIGIGQLLMQGIGDTIRVSLSSDPVDEVKAGFEIVTPRIEEIR